MAAALAERPLGEPLADALAAAVAGIYEPREVPGLPPGWLGDFRALVAREPGLHGEYLKASTVLEETLCSAIAGRMAVGPDRLEPRVLAAVVVAAERAGAFLVLHALLHVLLAVTLPTGSFLVAGRAVDWGTAGLALVALRAYLRRTATTTVPEPSASCRSRQGPNANPWALVARPASLGDARDG